VTARRRIPHTGTFGITYRGRRGQTLLVRVLLFRLGIDRWRGTGYHAVTIGHQSGGTVVGSVFLLSTGTPSPTGIRRPHYNLLLYLVQVTLGGLLNGAVKALHGRYCCCCGCCGYCSHIFFVIQSAVVGRRAPRHGGVGKERGRRARGGGHPVKGKTLLGMSAAGYRRRHRRKVLGESCFQQFQLFLEGRPVSGMAVWARHAELRISLHSSLSLLLALLEE
jgi:hypothetical protein